MCREADVELEALRNSAIRVRDLVLEYADRAVFLGSITIIGGVAILGSGAARGPY
jgi:hypothetical protein